MSNASNVHLIKPRLNNGGFIPCEQRLQLKHKNVAICACLAACKRMHQAHWDFKTLKGSQVAASAGRCKALCHGSCAAFGSGVLRAAVGPGSGVLFNVAEQLIHGHGHHAHHHQARKGQTHLHGRTG